VCGRNNVNNLFQLTDIIYPAANYFIIKVEENKIWFFEYGVNLVSFWSIILLTDDFQLLI